MKKSSNASYSNFHISIISTSEISIWHSDVWLNFSLFKVIFDEPTENLTSILFWFLFNFYYDKLKNIFYWKSLKSVKSLTTFFIYVFKKKLKKIRITFHTEKQMR